MQTALSRSWTRVTDSISYNDNPGGALRVIIVVLVFCYPFNSIFYMNAFQKDWMILHSLQLDLGPDILSFSTDARMPKNYIL